jgi:hypothetical protein
LSVSDFKSPDDIVPCFVIVSGGSSRNEPDKYYGPFVNFDAALQWICRQPDNVGFAIGCMRTPNKIRTSDDFHLPVRLEKSEDDFVDL